MVSSIKDKNSEIMITADGPKGPLREIKDGTILIAKKTGAALIPVTWYSSKKIFERSWDKFMMPLPFGKIIFRYGDPVYIPHDIMKDKYPDFKKKLKTGLDSLEEEIMAELNNNH